MKVVAVLYPGGPDAQKTPELLGCAENALGLRDMIEARGHELVALTDTESELEKHLPTVDVLIATPFWPAYITRERIEKAPNLRLLLTAGVGSDHFDLAAAAERNITVAEITGSNVVSVAEHVVMQILALVRNYIPSYKEVIEGGWDIGKVAARAHDLEDKVVGIVGMGRIGQRVAARLKPFDVHTYYFDYRRLSTAEEQLLGARYMTLTHFKNNAWADSATDAPEHDGLTPFGVQVVKEMQRLGMLVDLAHVSEATMRDVLALGGPPPIVSHSNARAINQHARNISDETLKAIGAAGGIVMVNFYPPYVVEAARQWSASRDAAMARAKALNRGDPDAEKAAIEAWDKANPMPRGSIKDVADHIDHIAKLIGADHAGLGGRRDHTTSLAYGLVCG